MLGRDIRSKNFGNERKGNESNISVEKVRGRERERERKKDLERSGIELY